MDIKINKEAQIVIEKHLKNLHFKEFLNNNIKEKLKISLIKDDAPKHIKENTTAHWYFVKEYNDSYHKITINPYITRFISDNSIMSKKYDTIGSTPYIDNIKKEVYLSYIEKYFYHEFAHALYTEKDLKKIQNILNENKIPFELLNTLEDARIEEAYRKNFNYKFNWGECEGYSDVSDFYDNPELIYNPLTVFLAFIQNEGVFTVLEKHKDVVEFYKKAINAKDTYEIIDLCKEWQKNFPEQKRETFEVIYENLNRSHRQRPDKYNDIDIQNSVIVDEYSFSINIDNCVQETDNKLYEQNIIVENNTIDSLDILRGDNIIDNERVLKNTHVFERILKSNIKTTTIIPRKNISIKNYISGKQNFFIKKDTGKNIRNTKDFSLIFDCSGSMSGYPLKEGLILISVLNNLSKKGMITGNIILTSEVVDNTITLVYPLPIDEEIIKKISVNGNEGFATTFKKVSPLLKKSDYVFVYTDGCIVDEPDTNYAKSHGICTYGMYAGDDDMTEKLSEYFDTVISRKSIEELINSIIKKVRSN